MNATPSPSSSTTTTRAAIRVEDHLALVWKVARQIARRLPRSVDVEELVGAGTLGLIDAVARYEERHCDRFAPYAEIRIRGAILDQLRSFDSAPRSIRRNARVLDEADRALRHKLGRDADVDEVAEHLGQTADLVEKMRHNIHSAVLVRDLDLEEHGGALPGADDVCIDRQLRARLAAAIAALPERHQQVLSLHYVEELKLREIGELLGVTESRVCQLVRESAKKLRAALNDD